MQKWAHFSQSNAIELWCNNFEELLNRQFCRAMLPAISEKVWWVDPSSMVESIEGEGEGKGESQKLK